MPREFRWGPYVLVLFPKPPIHTGWWVPEVVYGGSIKVEHLRNMVAKYRPIDRRCPSPIWLMGVEDVDELLDMVEVEQDLEGLFDDEEYRGW